MAGADVLLGKATGLPYDIQTKQAQLAAKRKILEALKARALSPSEMIDAGGPVKYANWGDTIGKLAQAWAGKSAMDEQNKEEQQVATDYNTRLSEGISKYLADKQGFAPAQGQDTRELDISGAEGAPPNASQGMPGQAPNPIKAIAEAMGSGIQPLQQLAAGDIPNLNKNQLDLKALLNDAWRFGIDPNGLVGQQLGAIGLRPPKDAMQINGAVVNTDKAGGIGPAQAPVTYAPPSVDAATGLPGQVNNVTGKFDAMTGGNVSTANARENAISGLDVKTLEEGRKGYIEGINGISNMVRTQALVNQIDPSKFGSLSEFRNGVNKFIEFLGGTKLPDTAGIEQVHSAVGLAMLEKIRKLAPVTQQDVDMMKSIIGSEGNTQRALQQMLEVGLRATIRGMAQHEQFVKNFADQPGVDQGFTKRYIPEFSINGDKVWASTPKGAAGKIDWDKYKLPGS